MSIGISDDSSTGQVYGSLPNAWFGISGAIDGVRSMLNRDSSTSATPSYGYDITGPVPYSYQPSSSASSSIVDYNATDKSQYQPTSLMLLERGCVLADGSRDCYHACYEDTAMMWTGLDAGHTLYNCILYPLIAKAQWMDVLYDKEYKQYSNGTYEIYPNGSSILYDAVPELLSKYGIIPDADIDLTRPEPWAGINNCTQAYCQVIGGGDCETRGRNGLGIYPDWKIGEFQPRVIINASLCKGADGAINPDLGGIGMIIAFVLQISILLGGWFISSINSFGVAVAAWATFVVRPVRTSKRKGTRWQQAKRLQRKVRRSRQSVALKVAMVEFLKTQTFFMLAVSVAAMLAVGNAAYLEVSSWQDLWNNIGFISTIALSGCYPTVLNMLVLRKTKTLSWYLLGISVACMAVATVLWTYTVVHKPRTTDITFTSTAGYVLPECGTGEALFNPTWTCLPNDNYTIKGTNADARILIFPLVVLVFMLVEELKVFHDLEAVGKKDEAKKVNVFEHMRQLLVRSYEPTLLGIRRSYRRAWYRSPVALKRFANNVDRMTRRYWRDMAFVLQHWAEKIARRSPPWLANIGTVVQNICTLCWASVVNSSTQAWSAYRNFGHINILLWTLNACYKIVPFLAELGILTFNIILLIQYAKYLHVLDVGAWSLGQVISVTIWVPVLVEYLYLLVCGIEEGFEYRLAEPYHVKRDDDSSDEEDGSGSSSGGHADDDQESIAPLKSGQHVYDTEMVSLQDCTEVPGEQPLLVAERPYTGT